METQPKKRVRDRAKPTLSIKGGARAGAGAKTAVEKAAEGYIDYNKARAKREHHNALMAQYEEQQRAGELVEVRVVKKAVEAKFATVRAKLLSLPSKVAPLLLGVDTLVELQAILEVAVRETLTDLHNGA